MFDKVTKARRPLDLNGIGPRQPCGNGPDREAVYEFVWRSPYVNIQDDTWPSPGIRDS